MAYCTVSDVQAMMGQTFTASTKPTTTEVQAAIDETAAELDGVAEAAGYAVPLSGDASVLILKRMNAYGASVNAWHSGVIADDEPARVTYWKEQYTNFITRLRKGEQTLPGDTPTASPNTGFSVSMKRVDGFATYNPNGEASYTTGYFSTEV